MRRLGIARIGRGGGLVFAALALAVSLMAPTGWMLATDAHGAPQLIICTGHMPASHHPAPGQPTNNPGDHPCAFAGHVTPTPPTPIASLSPSQTIVAVAPLARRFADQSPGRGLAAPPPPSQGPPADLA